MNEEETIVHSLFRISKRAIAGPSLMELFELRYFLAVAQTENLRQASEKSHVSPGSLSKAIARLEGELGVRLFDREKKTLRLTSNGRLLQVRASEIVHLEESAKLAVSGAKGTVHVVIAGSEILVCEFGGKIGALINAKYPHATFEYQVCNDDETLKRVARGDAHLGLVTEDVPSTLTAKTLAQATFQTCVGVEHPLYSSAKNGTVVPIEKVMTHVFASPSHPLLGAMSAKQSVDGWRDDQFPRQVKYLTSSIKLLEKLVVAGHALAYLPEYYARTIDVLRLKISGCPYSCHQKIKLVARNPSEVSWLKHWVG